MYYKLLNKTILTSALVAFICLQTQQVSAQELFGADDNVDISLPAEDQAPIEIQDDIPLVEDALIVPQQEVANKEVETPADSKPEIQKPVESSEDVSPKPAVEKPAKPSEDVLPKHDDFPGADFSEDFSFDDDADFMPVPPEPETPLFEKTAEPQAPVSNEQVKHEVKPQPNVAPRSPHQPAHGPKQMRPQAPVAAPATNNMMPPRPLQDEQLRFGDSVLVQSNNDLFNQMSDIEKQTTLLTLELKREKIRNEVEAAKAVRERAEQEKIAMEEAKARQQAEWEKEQEVKVIKAQEELKQKEIELEKLKQRKALTAYMNSMLEQKQSWITENAKLYDEIKTLKETNTNLRSSYKKDLENISEESSQVLKNAEIAKSNYDRTVASLTAQNAQLKKRIEADELAAKNGNANPFSGTKEEGNTISTPADALIKPINVAKEYAIMEITGKGDNLMVKLINKEGDSFMAKTGTVLATGHMVEEITPTYVQFDRNGLKDFLYTSTTALSTEPNKIMEGGSSNVDESEFLVRPRANLISDDAVPSVGDSMFVK